MILRGRFTVYGEYLMKTETRGLIVPTALRLASADHSEIDVHLEYTPERDKVAAFLRARGVACASQVRGDLPFGYGLASSTALALLHIHHDGNSAGDGALVRDSDRLIHGFEPSGVDLAAITRQESGLFASSGWEHVRVADFLYSLVFLPLERKRVLAKIELQIADVSNRLIPLANCLTQGVLADGALQYEKLFAYAMELSNAEIYSGVTCDLVSALLKRGVVAKGVGGLYDKAILIVWPDAATMARHEGMLAGLHRTDSPSRPSLPHATITA